MSTTEQKTESLKTLLVPEVNTGANAVKIMEIAYKATMILSHSGGIRVTAKIGGKSYKRDFGGGSEDEFLLEMLEEMHSLIRDLEGWLNEAKRNEASLELEIIPF